jgi:hypothetical protein
MVFVIKRGGVKPIICQIAIIIKAKGSIVDRLILIESINYMLTYQVLVTLILEGRTLFLYRSNLTNWVAG